MLLKARRWPVSSQDLPERVIILFTMSNNPHAQDGRGNSLWRSTRRQITRIAAGNTRSSTKHQNHHPSQTKCLQANWWSQTGSNRRPPECKSGALPTELWPHSWRGQEWVFPGLRRRRGHPSTWLCAPQGAAASRPCEPAARKNPPQIVSESKNAAAAALGRTAAADRSAGSLRRGCAAGD